MHATEHIFVRGGLSAPIIMALDPHPSYPKRRGSRGRNSTRLLDVTVWRFLLSDPMRSMDSQNRHFQPDLLRMVRWRPAHGRVSLAGRASWQRCRRSRRPTSRALLVARAPYLT